MSRQIKRKECRQCFRQIGKSFQYLFVFVSILLMLPHATYGQTSTLLDQIDRNTFSTDEPIELFAEFIPGHASQNSLITLKLWGRVKAGYHIYSISPQGEYSPEPTQLVVEAGPLLIHKSLSESETIWVQDEAFEERLRVHKNDFWLAQIYRVKKDQKPGMYSINGTMIYQICDQKICSFPISKPFTASLEIIN